MIFNIKQKKNKFIEENYESSMKELGEFYGINWVINQPKVFIIKDRKDVENVRGKKTEKWIIGWAYGFNHIYILDYDQIKKERKNFSKKDYQMFIQHELSHLFSKIITKEGYQPVWLWEGVAIYTSGQNEIKIKLEKFNQLLSFYEDHKVGKENVYYESGFFVQMLVEKFGKAKFIKFLKSLQKIKNRKEFDNLFFKIYKFKLNYKEINKIYG